MASPRYSLSMQSDGASRSDSLLDRLRRRLRPPRLLSVTRAGKFFILMTLAVGFGAINTGNNLLFLLLGMMLSLITASGVLSEAVLRNLSVRRRLPRRLYANQRASGFFHLQNNGWWPALSVETSEQNPLVVAGPRTGQQVGPETIPWWMFWRSQTAERRASLAEAYCLRLEAHQTSRLTAHYQLSQRGEYRLPGIQLKTRFPFGLFEKTRRLQDPVELTVFPEPVEAHDWLGRLESEWGDSATNRRGRGEEFYGLRQYRPGEDQRLIHWKSTARRGEPVVRETEARHRHSLLIVLDNRAPGDEITDDDHRQFELAIRHLAGLIRRLDQRGYTTELTSPGQHIEATATDGIEGLLRHLAVIELQPSSSPAPPWPDSFDGSIIEIGFQPMLSEDATATTLGIDELTAPGSEGSS